MPDWSGLTTPPRVIQELLHALWQDPFWRMIMFGGAVLIMAWIIGYIGWNFYVILDYIIDTSEKEVKKK